MILYAISHRGVNGKTKYWVFDESQRDKELSQDKTFIISNNPFSDKLISGCLVDKARIDAWPWKSCDKRYKLLKFKLTRVRVKK